LRRHRRSRYGGGGLRAVGRKAAKQEGTTDVSGRRSRYWRSPLVVTAFTCRLALVALPTRPDPNSFLRSGLAVSYAVPLLVIAATLVERALSSVRAARFRGALVVIRRRRWVISRKPQPACGSISSWSAFSNSTRPCRYLPSRGRLILTRPRTPQFHIAPDASEGLATAVPRSPSSASEQTAWPLRSPHWPEPRVAGVLFGGCFVELVRVQPTVADRRRCVASFVCVLLAIGTYFRRAAPDHTGRVVPRWGRGPQRALHPDWDTGNLLAAGALSMAGWLSLMEPGRR
jgi:hypothetical protein